MTQEAHARVLSVIVCGAGPATAIGTFVGLAQERGWTVQVIATCPAPADSNPESRRVRTYREQGGYGPDPTALKFPGFCDLLSDFLRLVTVWLHVGRGGVTGSGGP